MVEKGTRAGNSILSGCRVFFLPECPDAIDLGVVAKEYGGHRTLAKVSVISDPTPVNMK